MLIVFLNVGFAFSSGFYVEMINLAILYGASCKLYNRGDSSEVDIPGDQVGM